MENALSGIVFVKLFLKLSFHVLCKTVHHFIKTLQLGLSKQVLRDNYSPMVHQWLNDHVRLKKKLELGE
jgi:hypothetical protein